METQIFTSEQWQRQEKFVKMFRAAKQCKRAWQEKMEAKLKEEEDYINQRRIIDVFSKQIEKFRTNKPY